MDQAELQQSELPSPEFFQPLGRSLDLAHGAFVTVKASFAGCGSRCCCCGREVGWLGLKGTLEYGIPGPAGEGILVAFAQGAAVPPAGGGIDADAICWFAI